MAVTYLLQDDCDSLTGWIQSGTQATVASSAEGIYYSYPTSFKINTTGGSGYLQKMLDDPLDDTDNIYSLEYWIYFPAGWAAAAVEGNNAALFGFSNTAGGSNHFTTPLSVSKTGGQIVINEGDLDVIVPEEVWVHCSMQIDLTSGSSYVSYGAGSVSGANNGGFDLGGAIGWSSIGPGMHFTVADDLPAFYVDLIRFSKADNPSPGDCRYGEWTDAFGSLSGDWEFDSGNDFGAPAVAGGVFTAEYGNDSGGWGVRRGYLTGGIYGDVWLKYDFKIPAGFWALLDSDEGASKNYIVLPGFEIVGGWNGSSIGSMFSISLESTSVTSGQLLPFGSSATAADIEEDTWYELILGSRLTGNDTEDFFEQWLDEVYLGGYVKGETAILGTAPGGIYGASWSYDQGYHLSPGAALSIDNWLWSPCDSLRPETPGEVSTFQPYIMSY